LKNIDLRLSIISNIDCRNGRERRKNTESVLFLTQKLRSQQELVCDEIALPLKKQKHMKHISVNFLNVFEKAEEREKQTRITVWENGYKKRGKVKFFLGVKPTQAPFYLDLCKF